eukprot:Amastigsp_a853192_2.p4 type:complete len:109 gc:universal Amastigsp_a853192_2:828-502(-)
MTRAPHAASYLMLERAARTSRARTRPRCQAPHRTAKPRAAELQTQTMLVEMRCTGRKLALATQQRLMCPVQRGSRASSPSLCRRHCRETQTRRRPTRHSILQTQRPTR